MSDNEIKTDFDSTVTAGATESGQPEPAERRVPNPKGGGAKAIDPQRCTAPDCTTWATHESIKVGVPLCPGHDPYMQLRAKAARELKAKKLRLPPLDSAAHAKDWFRVIGEALAEKRMKPSEAGELRRLAVAYLDSDPSSILTDRLEAVEDALQRLSSKEEHWQG